MDRKTTNISRGTLRRYALYLCLLAGVTGLSSFLIQFVGGYNVVRENGPVEWVQFALLIIASAFIYIAGKADKSYKEMFHILSLMPIIAAVRELDDILTFQVDMGMWKLIALILCLYLVWHAANNFAAVKEQTLRFSKSQPFVYFAIGFFVVCVFARIIGQQSLWRALLQNSYQRAIGGFLEEIFELLGYTIILIGSLESFFQSRDALAADSSPRESTHEELSDPSEGADSDAEHEVPTPFSATA